MDPDIPPSSPPRGAAAKTSRRQLNIVNDLTIEVTKSELAKVKVAFATLSPPSRSLFPYSCPVQGCPRGHESEGFFNKRDAMHHEALAHGYSLSYPCPVCDNQFSTKQLFVEYVYRASGIHHGYPC